MKNKIIVLLILSIILTTTACSKYEKDYSVETDLYGSYSKHIDAPDISYSKHIDYTFYEDDTYSYLCKEVIDGTILNDIDKDGKTVSIEEISNDITKITLDQEEINWFTGETSNKIVYKYNNMLGTLYEIVVPKGRTFELRSDEFYFWFDKKGQYHVCIDESKCDCEKNAPQYIKKDNIIYFQAMDEEHKNTYRIGAYIVDKGMFFPEVYKTEK